VDFEFNTGLIRIYVAVSKSFAIFEFLLLRLHFIRFIASFVHNAIQCIGFMALRSNQRNHKRIQRVSGYRFVVYILVYCNPSASARHLLCKCFAFELGRRW
jgi:hypothetical protein